MIHPRFLHTRREFLRTGLLGGALAWTVPQFLVNSFQALHAEADGAAIQTVTGKDGPILVLLQLAGGNDGLNMVVPYASDDYYRARPTLGIPATSTLKLNEQVGFHPALTSLKSAFDAGHLQLIQNVGYPNPNRSHFRSTEIWETGSDSDRNEKYGWIGRYFDNACAGCDPTIGINVGQQLPQAFFSHTPHGISLKNPGTFKFDGGATSGEGESTEMAYRELNKESGTAEVAGAESGGSIGAVSGTMATGSPLEFIERTALDAQASSEKIRTISQTFRNQATYPATALGNDLQLIARLIGGGLPTRIYFASQGGYDTHHRQKPAHDSQMQALGAALGAFVTDLQAQGNFNRVLIMTFSEFGRRVQENGSQGTDHGAAAPHILMGGELRGGIVGHMPVLSPESLDHGDLAYEVDFRSVYAGVLEHWLKTPSAPILGRQFSPLAIV